MSAQTIGQTVQVVGVVAAPDLDNIRRLSALMGRAAADMDGTAGPGQVVGYDRGDAAHSFNGPVTLVPSPTSAINGTSSPGGIYRPTPEFQNGASQNPGLDPYNRALFARMVTR